MDKVKTNTGTEEGLNLGAVNCTTIKVTTLLSEQKLRHNMLHEAWTDRGFVGTVHL